MLSTDEGEDGFGRNAHQATNPYVRQTSFSNHSADVPDAGVGEVSDFIDSEEPAWQPFRPIGDESFLGHGRAALLGAVPACKTRTACAYCDSAKFDGLIAEDESRRSEVFELGSVA